MTFDIASLDGAHLLALRSNSAYGCNGWEDTDSDGLGRSTLVFGLDPDVGTVPGLEDLIATWDTLWLASSDDEGLPAARQAALALGTSTWPEPLHGSRPVWNEDFEGTLDDFQIARDLWKERNASYNTRLQERLSWARLEMFRQAGASAVSVDLPMAMNLVHDFGCRCGHHNPSEGDGRGKLVVRDGQVLACPADMDADTLTDVVGRATQAGQDAQEKAERNARERAARRQWSPTDPNRYLDLEVPATPSVQEGGLRFAQWLAGRTERATKVARLVGQERWDELAAMGYAHLRPQPNTAREQAYSWALAREDVAVLSRDDAEELSRTLGR